MPPPGVLKPCFLAKHGTLKNVPKSRKIINYSQQNKLGRSYMSMPLFWVVTRFPWKRAHTWNSHVKLGPKWKANHGCYLFSSNLLTAGIGDFLFFAMSFFEHVLDRHHHWNLNIFCSKICCAPKKRPKKLSNNSRVSFTCILVSKFTHSKKKPHNLRQNINCSRPCIICVQCIQSPTTPWKSLCNKLPLTTWLFLVHKFQF